MRLQRSHLRLLTRWLRPETDEASARSEWLAEFRSDLESYVDRERVEACVVPGRVELPRVAGLHYVAFADPSGGKADSFTLCIAHREGDRCVVDVLRERKPPFSPDDAVREFAALCASYGVSTLHGDRYAASWVTERFRTHGVRYANAPLTKSDLYVHLLGPLNSGRLELLDVSRLVGQLVSLERRTARSTGRDSIDHAPGSHDDVANTLAGAVYLVLGKKRPKAESFHFRDVYGPGRWATPAEITAWERRRWI